MIQFAKVTEGRKRTGARKKEKRSEHRRKREKRKKNEAGKEGSQQSKAQHYTLHLPIARSRRKILLWVAGAQGPPGAKGPSPQIIPRKDFQKPI